MNEKYYSIGELSKACNVTIRTLRYYDEIGILKPDFINNKDYRFYSPDKIINLNYIRILKDLNFSLKEISNFIHHDIDFEIINEVYRNKLDVLNKEIESLKEIKLDLKNKISKINLVNTENVRKEKIIIKKIPAVTVAKEKFTGKLDLNIFALNLRKFKTMLSGKKIKSSGYYKSISYNFRTFDFNNSDMDIYVKIDDNLLNKFSFIEKRKAYSCVSYLHHGPYETLQDSSEFLFDWLDENNYKHTGNIIYIYIICYDITLDSKKFVTELQIPLISS